MIMLHFRRSIVVIACCISLQVFSQVTREDTTLVKNFRLDFAVPDQPAFKMLGTNPSEILRPSSVNDLSVIATEFMSGSSIVLPRAIALEVAPFMLAKANKITLQEYDEQKILNSVRISLGSQFSTTNSTQAYKLSLGARVTIFDKGDLKTDQGFRSEIYKLTADKTELENKLKIEYLNRIGKTIMDYATDPEVEAATEEYISNESAKYIDMPFDKRLERLRQDYKAKNWNKSKLDFAAAVLTQSPDSLAQNITFQSFGFWATYAVPVKTWGQVLAGLNYSYLENDGAVTDTLSNTSKEKDNRLNLSSRFYFGTNRIKGFAEAAYYYSGLEETNNALLNLGTEINPFSGVWITLNGGYLFNDIFENGGSSQLFTSFDIRFQLPEKFRLF